MAVGSDVEQINKKRKFDQANITSRNSSNGTDNGHEKTPADIVNPAWGLAPGPPSYTHVVLPFIYEREHTHSYDSDEIYTYDRGFRMTSVYDPVINNLAAVDLNVGVGRANAHTMAADAGEPRTNNAEAVAYFDYYSSLYKYYSVVGCRYKIRVENLSHEKFFVHQMFVNAETPPAVASNWDILLWKGVKSQLLHPKGIAADTTQVHNHEIVDENYDDAGDMVVDTITNMSGVNAYTLSNPIGSSMVYFTGEYHPGDHDHMIALDNDVEIWTAINANPKLREAILLRIKPYENSSPPVLGDANNYERRISFNITVELNYLVEFKELDIRARYPINRNPISIFYNSDPR